jgi:hypothetical protein
MSPGDCIGPNQFRFATAATLSYVETLTRVQCHKYAREEKMVWLGR